MSSFMVSDRTLGCILYRINSPWDEAIIDAVGEEHMGGRLVLDVWHALTRMNLDALRARYSDETHEYPYVPDDVAPMPCTRVQAFKSLTCYIYQCTEGEVPSNPLYLALVAMRDEWACDIVRALPEYGEARWD